MLVKFSTDDPIFEQLIELLKLKYRTRATSKAAKRALYDFHQMELENEILRSHNESMSEEIDRLRTLMEVYRGHNTGTKWRYLR